MRSYVERLVAETPLGQEARLPAAGTPLENPWAFDAGARELLALAHGGRVDIVQQETRSVGSDELIVGLVFRRRQ